MSYSTVYQVYKTRVRGFAELPNGWLSAPQVWAALSARYLGTDTWMTSDPAEMTPLWALATDPKVPEHWRIAHAMTLDRALVPVARLEEAAAACDAVHTELSGETSHWRAIARALREIAQKPPARLVGVALNPTSVCDNWIGCRAPLEGSFDCVAYARLEPPADAPVEPVEQVALVE